MQGLLDDDTKRLMDVSFERWMDENRPGVMRRFRKLNDEDRDRSLAVMEGVAEFIQQEVTSREVALVQRGQQYAIVCALLGAIGGACAMFGIMQLVAALGGAP